MSDLHRKCKCGSGKKARWCCETVRPVLIKDNDKETIAKVTTLLTDESFLNKFDPTILPTEINFCKKYNCSRHPLTGCCLAASVLFLQNSNHANDFRVFHLGNIPLLMFNKKGDVLSWFGDHYWLKNMASQQVIDVTKTQFTNIIDGKTGDYGFNRYKEGEICWPVWGGRELKAVVNDKRPSGQQWLDLEQKGVSLAV